MVLAATIVKFGLFGSCSGGVVSTTVVAMGFQKSEKENVGYWLQQWSLGLPAPTTSGVGRGPVLQSDGVSSSECSSDGRYSSSHGGNLVGAR